MTSLDIYVLATELNKFIRESRIIKIYQVNHKILLLKLRSSAGENLQLLVEAGKRGHLTSYEVEKPKRPPVFCMALRKYLENGVVREVSQYDFERILEIRVERGGQKYRLIIELFGEGNIILVDPDNKILHALTYRKMRDRNIVRNEEFNYPPRRGEDPRQISLEDLKRIREFGQIEVVKGLTRLLSIGGFYAEEILQRAGIDKNKYCSSLEAEELNAIFRGIKSLISQIEDGGYRPCVFVDESDSWVDVAPIPLEKYAGLRVIEFETFNRALDEYYARVAANIRVASLEESVKREIANLERILREQEKNLSELREELRVYQRLGDIIYGHLYELDSLISRVMSEKRSGREWDEIARMLLAEKEKSIMPSVYFVSINPDALTLKVSVDGETFDLNLMMSAQRNAAEYYSKAKRAKDKIEGLEKAIEQTKMRVSEIRAEVIKKAETAYKAPQLRRKREWYEKFRWFFSSEGFLVIGGRDASTNEALIKKYMEPHDIVLHADIAGSPFVLVKTMGKTPAEKTIDEAAQFTASYSRAWREQIRAIDVYWVRPEQVSKTPPSGQYLPRGSFMIYGSKNFIKNVPLEIAIGVRRENGDFRVVGGPVSAIAGQTNLYVKVVPGRETSGRLAKEIRDRLANMAYSEDREKILRIPLEEFQAFIPSGLGSIAEE